MRSRHRDRRPPQRLTCSACENDNTENDLEIIIKKKKQPVAIIKNYNMI